MSNESTLPLTNLEERERVDELGEREYIEVLKNLIEIPKYLASLLVFLATATAAISRIAPVQSNGAGGVSVPVDPISLSDRVLFVIAMLLTVWVLFKGYSVVAHALHEMTRSGANSKDRRLERFSALRNGPYSQFVGLAMLPLGFWMVCLISMVW